MRMRVVAIVCVAALLSGCGFRHLHMVDPVSSPSDRDEINRALAGTSVRMTLADGSTESGVFMSVGADSTMLAHAEDVTTRIVVPTVSVRSMTLVRRGIGAAKGLGCGAAAGAVAFGATCLVLGLAGPDPVEDPTLAKTVLLIVVGAAALAALPLGLLFGAAAGDEQIYIFAVPELAPPSPAQGQRETRGKTDG
jgi:hypothetical protein